MSEKMKKALAEALEDGEHVLWESGTAPFGILEGKEGRRTLVRWIVSALVMGALAVPYCIHGGSSGGFFALILGIFAILALAPVAQYRQIRAQRYVITEKRAILIRRGGMVYAMKLPGMEACRAYTLDFGGVAIALGASLLGEGDRQLRWRSAHPDESTDSGDFIVVRGLVFYRAERADEALRLLKEQTAEEV